MKYTIAINDAKARAVKIHKAFVDLMSESTGDSLSKKLRRERFEQIQRECAMKRLKKIRQSLPKVDRAAGVRDARDAKQSHERDWLVEEQSGYMYGAAAAGVTAAAAAYYGVRYATKKVTSQLDVLLSSASRAVSGSETVAKIDDLLSSATRASDAVGDTFGSLSSFFDNIKAIVKSIVDIIKAVGGAFWKLAVGAFVLAIKSLAAVHKAIKDLVVAIVEQFVPDVSVLIDFGDMPMQQDAADMVGKIAAMTACFVTPKGDTPMQTFMTIMGRVGNFGRASQGIEGVFNTSLLILEKCLNACLGLVGKDGVKLVGVAARQVLDWCKDVDDVFMKIDTENPTIADLNRAKALIVTGYNLKNTLQAPYLREVLGRQLDKLNARISAHRGLLEIENTYRQQPTLVMFGGASAVGKTFLIKNFASAVLVMSGLCKPNECAQNMWQKGEDRFFNGYCGQLVYIMDDVFQKKAVKGSDECEGMTIIRAVNSWPFPLPFADVESKGRFFFNSKLMVGTTNQMNIKTDLEQVLAQPEAVLRRITHGYWLTVNPEYGIAKDGSSMYTLDYRKVERVHAERLAELRARESYTVDDVLAAVPWDAWQLTECRFDGSDSGCQGPSVFSLLKQVADELRAGATRHDGSVKQLNAWLHMFEQAADFQPAVVEQSGISSVDADDLVCYYEESCVVDSMPAMPTCDSAEFVRPIRGRNLTSNVKPVWLDALIKAKNEELDWRVRMINHLKYCICGLAVPGQRGDSMAGLLEWVSTIAITVRVLLEVGKLCKSLIRALWKIIFPEPVPAEPAEEQSVHFQPKVYPKKKVAPVVPSAVAQLGNPPSNTLSDIVYRNTWKLIADDQMVGQVVFMRGTIGVMPYHFRKGLCAAKRVEMISCGASGLRAVYSGVDFDRFVHVDYESADLMFVDFSPVCARAHRDIVKYCVLDRDVSHDLVGSNDLAVRMDVARTYKFNDVYEVERVQLVTRGLRLDPVVTVGRRDVNNCWAYGLPTECGDCGAPLTFAEPRFFGGKAILGIHIAGRTRAPGNGGQREGWSAILTQELVHAALRSFKGVIHDNFVESLQARGIVVDEDLSEVVAESGLAQGSMSAIGMVPVDKTVSQSVRSKIKKSGFTGFGPCPMAPAHLAPVVKDGVIVEPMHVAMANYQGPLHISTVPNEFAVMSLAMKKHSELTMSSTRRLLSFEEAVCGVPHLKLKSINRSSSAGYPYNLQYARGKRDIFGDGDEFDLQGPAVARLRGDVERIVSAAKSGVREAHVFVDFLKDETRPLAKVEAVATRAISGAPLDYSVAVRQYFGAFMSSVYLNHTVCGMAPGINYYTEWDILANSLLKPGGKVFAGDFKAFDASEQPDVHRLCLRYINDWYSRFEPCEEDNRVRTVLFEDLVHSRHLTGIGCVRDSLVQWNKSLPSGHPLTTIVNSMYSLYTLTACYVSATGDLTHMWDKVFACTYGDDNVVGVSDEVSDVFNQVTVADMMRDIFQLKYTSDKKDAELVPYESIDDITFLKRGFVRAECDGGWAAPLDLNSILYRTYFYRSDRTFTRDQAQNFADALMELSLHPEEEWGDRFRAATEYCARQGIPLPIVSREQARQLCFARTDVWF